ncbi:programmed cell death protein 2 isoform X2 [Belonocnema kinseyi]|uniref:programmed cell death protein 2 isoform X2 n=1 Tax=Belonocnema kinseyi TaxID=2817044 RepID=UPI00143D2C89|nr:programmed cell death protein 2 isoform X2 [Belonocnema kinseyi]
MCRNLLSNMGKVDIGFAEECESWRLQSRFFRSKIGGNPAWLNLKTLPKNDQISCDYCKDPCIFLCQVYAPYEEDARAFHRTLYIFICKNPNCCKTNKAGNLKVVRSQLERLNEFYPSNPPEENKAWRTDIKFELVIEPERKEKEAILEKYFQNKDIKKEIQEIKKYESLVTSGHAGTLISEPNVDADLIQMSNRIEDVTFFEFQEHIKNDPDQVLRYDRGGFPLYISSINQVEYIPKCEECNSERQFEFQIMPQLINYLDFEDPINSLDWGIIGIFTCKKSCVPKAGYVSEWIWKQDIVENETVNICKSNTP